jgi:uncharacterized protein with HEPN domain
MPRFNIKREDEVRLRHILDAATEIQQYVHSSTREDLSHDRKLAHSLVHLLEIIGEAASQVSPGLRDDVPSIPWNIIVGMRNRLIHAHTSPSISTWSGVPQPKTSRRLLTN